MAAQEHDQEFWFSAIWTCFVAICIILTGLEKLKLGDGVLAALAGSVVIPTAARAFARILRR